MWHSDPARDPQGVEENFFPSSIVSDYGQSPGRRYNLGEAFPCSEGQVAARGTGVNIQPVIFLAASEIDVLALKGASRQIITLFMTIISQRLNASH